MKKVSVFKILGLAGAVVLIIFGGIKNISRTLRLVFDRLNLRD